MTRIVSILLPAHDEGAWITACLQAVMASDPMPPGWRAEVLVIANGCSDDTADRARQVGGARVIELPQGGKLNALNQGEAQAQGEILIYLDADVIVSPPLLAGLVRALDTAVPRYASGQPQVSRARSWITRAYARLWVELPFLHTGVPGFGLFAMNRAGRARWDDWPDIISDDTFARLQFGPDERVRVPATYDWPMVEGFANLVRVRRRQDAGVTQIRADYSHLLTNDDKVALSRAGKLRLLLRNPLAFAVYAAVALAVKSPLFRSQSRWARGR